MRGTADDSSMVGDAGDDTVLGDDGDDRVAPGTGKDEVHGESGDDQIGVYFFEFGDTNMLFGGSGADTFEVRMFSPVVEDGRIGDIMNFDHDEDDRIVLHYTADDGLAEELIPVGAGDLLP